MKEPGIDTVAFIDARENRFDFIIEGTAFPKLLVNGASLAAGGGVIGAGTRHVVGCTKIFFHIPHRFGGIDEAVIGIKDPDTRANQLIHTCKVLAQHGGRRP